MNFTTSASQMNATSLIENWANRTKATANSFLTKTVSLRSSLGEVTTETWEEIDEIFMSQQPTSIAHKNGMEAATIIVATFAFYVIVLIVSLLITVKTKNSQDAIMETDPNSDVVSERTAKYLKKVQNRCSQRISRMNNALDRKQEDLDLALRCLSECYEAIVKLDREKSEYSHDELKLCMHYVLPREWCSIEYHEMMEEITSEHRLEVLHRIKPIDRTIRDQRARSHAPPPGYSPRITNPFRSAFETDSGPFDVNIEDVD